MHVKQCLVASIAVVLLGAPAVHALDKESIKKAVDAGVSYLKQRQNQTSGQWDYIDKISAGGVAHSCGMTALAGLALVVCDVPASDPAVQKAAAFVRKGAPTLVDTYSLSLCIMFLDKLGDRHDENLIKGMAVRLIQGQKEDGAWSYDCPRTSFEEAATSDKGKNPSAPSGKPINQEEFIRKQMQMREQHGQPVRGPGGVLPAFTPPQLPNMPGPGMRLEGDNSNTQFATIALWIARRHSAAADDSLARVSRYFRACQNPDGGWSYLPSNNAESSASMTCAGLIGLAVGKGLKGKNGNNGKARYDSRVARGLNLLGQRDVGRPVDERRMNALVISADRIGVYYFLWSLERAAMIYGLKTIQKKDWYNWAAEVLVVNQRPDGSWHGKYSYAGPADTCFALMVLKRSNLAEDLTRALHGPQGGSVERALRPRGLNNNDEPAAQPDEEGLAGADRPSGDSPRPGSRTPGRHGKGSQPSGPALPSTATESDPLASRLAAGDFDKQKALLGQYRDGKGSQYTDGLAAAIHHLSGETRERVRDTLAERLARMTAGTLRAKLQDEDNEVRSAAALACGMKQEQSLVPDLIEALKDQDSRVPQAARVALKSLTSQDFGPAPTATKTERSAAAARWKRWWQKHHTSE